MRLCWQYLTSLQVKAAGPNFHAELIPAHSPLLWGSCLVSCPPLTYMLKFSRFASLTSCLKKKKEEHRSIAKQAISIQCMAQVAVGKQSFACIMHNKGVLGTLACTYTQVAHKHTMKHLCLPPEVTPEDTKAGMLSGISQKHNTRSKLY